MDLLIDWISTKIYEANEANHAEFIIKRSSKDKSPYKIQYDRDAGMPCYWVLPLSNFLFKFFENPASLKTHPLRININNKIIKYTYEGEEGFIEPLPDYQEREKQLLDGSASSRITSVMIGSIDPKNAHSIDLQSLEKWFPFTFLPLLGFAVGNDISSPCIELRDENCRLVRRIIIQFENPAPFSRGHAVISGDRSESIGRLLTLLPSEHKSDTYLRVVLKHITRGGLKCHDIEEKMSYIIRGFDCLGEEHHLGVQQLANCLDASQQSKIKSALGEGAKKIEEEAENAKKSGQLHQCRCLRRIADRVRNASNTDRNFGLEVVELLRRYGFPDAEIIDNFYNNYLGYSRDWIQILNDYRGKPMHPGYFKFKDPNAESNNNGYDFEGVYVVAKHLHDILIRIVLKELRYDVTYRPAVYIPENVTLSQYVEGDFNSDWVKPTTPAFVLGFITETEKEDFKQRADRFEDLLRKHGFKKVNGVQTT